MRLGMPVGQVNTQSVNDHPPSRLWVYSLYTQIHKNAVSLGGGQLIAIIYERPQNTLHHDQEPPSSTSARIGEIQRK